MNNYIKNDNGILTWGVSNYKLTCAYCRYEFFSLSCICTTRKGTSRPTTLDLRTKLNNTNGEFTVDSSIWT